MTRWTALLEHQLYHVRSNIIVIGILVFSSNGAGWNGIYNISINIYYIFFIDTILDILFFIDRYGWMDEWVDGGMDRWMHRLID